MKIKLLSILLLLTVSAISQNSYSLHSRVKDFTPQIILNNTNGFNNFNSISSDLIILDFFGTWCIPCIKALPLLSSLQQQFGSKLTTLLISNEQKIRLEKFISNRQPFPFPVVADEDNSITALFAPPAYPYTVVLNREKEIIALTDAESITAEKIQEWLAGKKDNKTAATEKNTVMTPVNLLSANKLVQLSQEFMYAAKTGDSTISFAEKLAGLAYADLKTGLPSDEEKKAFWINLYNGYTNMILKADPGKYKKRSTFFGSKQINIAGSSFSLDDIEHGILRRSKIKWSLGHLNKWFPNKTERALRVKELDYRLHFALNCGAKSCPPIAFYNPENLNPQLELATASYLKSEVEYDAVSNTVKLPAIMGWFRRDFGGKQKMIALLKEKKIIPQKANPRIRFKTYDWTLYTDNYKN